MFEGAQKARTLNLDLRGNAQASAPALWRPTGLNERKEPGFGAVAVLGHPWFYPRSGFVPASRFGLKCRVAAANKAFMALELTPGYLKSAVGTVVCHPAFRNVA